MAIPAVLIHCRRASHLFQTCDHGAIRDTHLQAGAGLEAFRTKVALFNQAHAFATRIHNVKTLIGPELNGIIASRLPSACACNTGLADRQNQRHGQAREHGFRSKQIRVDKCRRYTRYQTDVLPLNWPVLNEKIEIDIRP